MKLGAIPGKAAEDDAVQRRRAGQRFYRRIDGDLRSTLGGKTKGAGRNGGKSDRGKRVTFAKLDGAPVAGGELLVFALSAAIPDRSNSMNDVAGGQLVATGDF